MKTTSQIASEQGCNVVTVRRWALRLGVAKRGKDFEFAEADEALILANIKKRPGNPNFVPGNYFGNVDGRPKLKKRRNAA